jgi:hypothetical protein
MLAEIAYAAINCAAILALQPPLSPQPSLAPPGERGSSTAVFGRVFEVAEFNVSGQPSKWLSTTAYGRVFEVVEFMGNGKPSKWLSTSRSEWPALPAS